MNLLEILILRVFLVLFSLPSCPAMEKKADAAPVEMSAQEDLQAVSYTPEIAFNDEAAGINGSQKNPLYQRDCCLPPECCSVHAGDCELKGGPELRATGSPGEVKY